MKYKTKLLDPWDAIAVKMAGDEFSMCDVIEQQYHGRVNGVCVQDYILLPDSVIIDYTPEDGSIVRTRIDGVTTVQSNTAFKSPWE